MISGGLVRPVEHESATQDRHKHLADLQIYAVPQGAMTIRIADANTLILKAGDEIVIPTGVVS